MSNHAVDDEVVVSPPKEKGFWEFAIRNPAPIAGVLGTTGILTYGVWNMLKDNKQEQARMLKSRVYGQAATFGLVILTMGWAEYSRRAFHKEN